MQDVFAIALTPPTLELDSIGSKTFTVFNTNNFDTNFAIQDVEGLEFSENEFILGAKGNKTIHLKTITFEKDDGIIYVKESLDDINGIRLENGIGLKYHVNNENGKPLDKISGAFAGIDEKKGNKKSLALSVLLAIGVLVALLYKNEKVKLLKDKASEHLFYYRFMKRNSR